LGIKGLVAVVVESKINCRWSLLAHQYHSYGCSYLYQAGEALKHTLEVQEGKIIIIEKPQDDKHVTSLTSYMIWPVSETNN
jgi:hypothetical protein